MESSGPSAAPEFDVYEAMDWKDGVGTLPGSELKFRVNEFGVLEVITDEMEEERGKKAHATTTWSVPTAHEGKHTIIHSRLVFSALSRSHFTPQIYTTLPS
ncbi:lethal(3)malignant brain tumor-like protein [Pimephales promelas]|nr:lethal(3)malignant brain tumor-like protein [Pimephales promelas]